MESLSFEKDAGAPARRAPPLALAVALVGLGLGVTLTAIALAGDGESGAPRNGAAMRDLDEPPVGRPGRRF